MSLFFFFYGSGAHRDLHSLPTRRSSDLHAPGAVARLARGAPPAADGRALRGGRAGVRRRFRPSGRDRKSTRLNSSHSSISYAVFCLKKKKKNVSRHPFNTSTKTPSTSCH